MLRDPKVPSRLIAGAAALWIGLQTPLLLAQTDEQRAAARSLATEGATAFSEQRWKDAIDRFTRAESLVHASPHLLFLARAHEKLGQLVRAREAYLKIVRETLDPSAPRAFQDARAAAEQELRTLEPRLSSLTIKIQAPSNAKDPQVLLDGTAVPAVLVGVARPTDPGEHRVEGHAGGFLSTPVTFRLADGERRTVTLTFRPDPNAPPPENIGEPVPEEPPASAVGPTSRTTRPALTGGQPPPFEPAPRESAARGLRVGSYVAFGVGAAGLGVGSFFLGLSSNRRRDADDAYAQCTAQGDCRERDASAVETRELDNDARSALTVSIIGLSVGGAAAVLGTTLFLLSAGSEESPQVRLSVRPYLGLGGAGLLGSF